MSTSAERSTVGGGVLRDGTVARLRPLPYDDPLAQHLIGEVQQEYVVRYGGRDAAVVDPAEFTPPQGLFLVAEVDGVPAGCGGWRAHADGAAELKRMYVEPGFRRQGIAALLPSAARGCRASPGGGKAGSTSPRFTSPPPAGKARQAPPPAGTPSTSATTNSRAGGGKSAGSTSAASRPP